jgi:ubiquinone/menaquinone biosynthesis C-methylase UbiE
VDGTVSKEVGMEDTKSQSPIVPFYGGDFPRMFAIERRCMDRDGKVLSFLHQALPVGTVLDIGAGNGYTAEFLTTPERRVVALEPDQRMMDTRKPVLWARGIAQRLPFRDAAFHAAYATWAFFFSGLPGIEEGLSELHRVVRPGGPLLVVDNAGDDEFCALAAHNIASSPSWWQSRGFRQTVLHTSFRFDSLTEARELLTFYFGTKIHRKISKTEIEYKVAVYRAES